MPFYNDWTFWSFLVAFIALILSQSPKINVWFKRNRIELEIHNKITVQHWLGVPSINLFLGINNKGRTNVKIKKIELIINREGLDEKRITCSSFYETHTSQFPNLFFPFELFSEKSWDHSCWFTIDIERTADQKFRGIFTEIDKDIANKRKNTTTQNELIEAEESLVKPLIEYKDKKFIWESGEYFVEIILQSDPRIDISKNFRFTLFETDTNTLKAYSDDYKYGMTYHNQKNLGLIIPISQDSTQRS